MGSCKRQCLIFATLLTGFAWLTWWGGTHGTRRTPGQYSQTGEKWFKTSYSKSTLYNCKFKTFLLINCTGSRWKIQSNPSRKPLHLKCFGNDFGVWITRDLQDKQELKAHLGRKEIRSVISAASLLLVNLHGGYKSTGVNQSSCSNLISKFVHIRL